ncbi:MAG: GNAT family N-acetyltransferase [Gemmatimonadota bacterium]
MRAANAADGAELRRLMRALFPEHDHDELDAELDVYITAIPQQAIIFVAERTNGTLGGFVEIGTRSYAEDCDSSPVPYIEAWYVDPDLRRQGVGGRLFRAAEDWARGQGFTEIASDAQLGNEISITAHRALGYQETERIVCFRRSLE